LQSESAPLLRSAAREPGRSLPAEVRRPLEARTSHDFGRARVDFGRISIHPVAPADLPRILTVNTGAEACEQEAERLAKHAEHNDAVSVRETAPQPTGSSSRLVAPSIVREVLRTGGTPLPPATRVDFEPRFDFDFSSVRVHAGAKAAESARAIGARAYAAGVHVVLENGQSPQDLSEAGRASLAHELVHVTQQARGFTGHIQRQPAPQTSAAPTAVTTPAEDYKPATSFAALVTLIKSAETKLKAAGQNVMTRLKTLRGIYYGTTWSFDFVKAEGSAMRNLGFTYFLYGRDAMMTSNNMFQKAFGDESKVEPDPKYIPMNPQAILGPKLFEALRNSYEVTNADGRKVDVGHLIIGLEARLSKGGQETAELTDPRGIFSPDPMGGTGLELTTWVGDLGGGTALVAQKRTSAPDTDARLAFADQHSYGAQINLEGDVAAFLVGLPVQSTTPYGLIIDETTGVGGALDAYLTPASPGQAWNERAKRFLTLYNAKFDATNNLTNRSTVVVTFAEKLRRFAYFYKETRLKDEANKKQSVNKLTSEQEKAVNKQMEQVGAKIPGAANEVATLFVDALAKSVKEPGRGIAP
jgi:hypothetical protein